MYRICFINLLCLFFIPIDLACQEKNVVKPKCDYYPECDWIFHIARSGTVYPFCKLKECEIKRISVFREASPQRLKSHVYYINTHGEVHSIKYFRKDTSYLNTEIRKSLGEVCKSDLKCVGAPNEKVKFQTKENENRGEITILNFNEKGLLSVKKVLKKGLIKYNNSWAGSFNNCTRYEYDNNNVIAITEYISHTRFFKKKLSKSTIDYNHDNLPITYSETKFIEGEEFRTSTYFIEYNSEQ